MILRVNTPAALTAVTIWLRVGAGLKRWLVLATLAMVIANLGIGLMLADYYRVQPLPEVFFYLTLQFVPRLTRGLLLLGAGIGLGAFAWLGFSQSLIGSLLPGHHRPVVRTVVERNYLAAGPRVVAIGGGTGLSTLLQGLKEVTANITAIVTVADDGGSSGRLRRDLGILPPGDFRQCLAALADSEPLMARLLQHRFGPGSDLMGHSFGNLFLTAMAEVTGSFEKALEECSRVLAVRGRILPSTLADVTLCAELVDGRVLRGESVIGHAGSPIRRVFLDPPDAAAYPPALKAIREAETIILGPGSLFTSLLPNLLVDEIAEAVSHSKARRVFICNVATEPGETVGFGADDFIRILREHVSDLEVQWVLVNDNLDISETVRRPVELVRPGAAAQAGPQLRRADVINVAEPSRHDPRKLASALLEFAL